MARSNAHYGGAWKVAYADFVTAMMALFMVLWLTSQNEQLRQDLARFFQDPYNTPMDKSMGVISDDSGSTGNSDGKAKGKVDINDVKVLHDMAREFMKLLNVESVNPSEDSVAVEVTSDGLRVTLYDRDAHPFFNEDTAEYTPWGKFVVEQMAWLVQRHSFGVRIDGFVSEGFEAENLDYTAWELSSDRANATRRWLEHYGVMPQQFESVTSHADRKPLPFVNPTDEANDRVSISLVLGDSFNKYDYINE